MASVVQFRVHPVKVPLLRPFTTAVRSADTLETVLLELVDDGGCTGWGEAPISRVTGVSTAQVLAAAEEMLAPLVLGTKTGAFRETARDIAASAAPAAARMAADCALHDVAAAAAGLPLAQFLVRSYPGLSGGTGQHVGSGRLLTDMTLSVDEAPALAAAARGYADTGFRCLKVKLSADGDPVGRLLAVRNAVGPGIALRVDANQAYTAKEAIAAIRGMEAAGVGLELVEQPVPAGDLAALAEVRSRVTTPIMADESVWDRSDLESLLACGSADLVNVKLAKAGGLYPAIELVLRARAAGLGVLVGCMLESTVGIGSAAALAAAAGLNGTFPGSSGQDLDGGLWLREPAVTGGPAYAGAEILLPDLPGLGIRGLAAQVASRS